MNAHNALTELELLHVQIATMLGQANYRYTGSRRRLVEALAISGRPLTLPEIITAEPTLAQSSAYRNLEVLEQIGITCRISVGNEHTHFELSESLLGHHHHMICMTCGAIRDVSLDAKTERLIERNLSTAASQAHFTPTHHNLDLYGRCIDCTRKNGPQATRNTTI